MKRDEITVAVAARLVARQFPRWAHLPITPVVLGGWDNITYRLGDHLLIRLPSGPGYVGQVQKEQRWLPVLAPQLPVAIPEPVGVGVPRDGFPWPWSIYRWIGGAPASLGHIDDLTDFATQLGGFLAALYRIEPDGAPAAGPHSCFRGDTVGHFAAGATESIELLADVIDPRAATEVWEAAVASTSGRAPVWVHGDVTGSNLLVADGSLCAVIDFGCSAVGDPACDLEMAWTCFDGESSAAFRDGVPVDDATWTHARGWALWRAMVAMATERKGGIPAAAAARRFGWRHMPYDVANRVVADHKRTVG